MFWATLKVIFARAARQGFELALRRAQNIFMPKNRTVLLLLSILGGVEKIKTGKKKSQPVTALTIVHKGT